MVEAKRVVPTENENGEVEATRPNCDSCHHRRTCLLRKCSSRNEFVELRESLVVKGEIVFDDESLGGYVHVLKSGSIKIASNTDLENSAYGFYYPQSVFLFDGFLGSKSKHNAVALEQTRICKMPAYNLLESVSGYPNLFFSLVDDLRNRLDYKMDFIEKIKGKKSTQKMAGFILHILDSGKANARDREEICFPMSRIEIGTFLGIAHESVSRSLKYIADQGAISVHGKRIQINSICRLEEIFN